MHTVTGPPGTAPCSACPVAFTLFGALPCRCQPHGVRNLRLTSPKKFESRTEYSNLTQASVFGASCPVTTGKWGLGRGEAASDIAQPGLGRCPWPFCGRGQPSQAWPQTKRRCLARQTLGWALRLVHSGPAVQSGWMSKERPGKGGGALCPLHQL